MGINWKSSDQLSMGKSCNFANLIRSWPCRNVTLNFLYILFQPLDRKIVLSCIVFRLTFNNVNFIQGKWGMKRAKAFLSTVGKTLSAPAGLCYSILKFELRKISSTPWNLLFWNMSSEIGDMYHLDKIKFGLRKVSTIKNHFFLQEFVLNSRPAHPSRHV